MVQLTSALLLTYLSAGHIEAGKTKASRHDAQQHNVKPALPQQDGNTGNSFISEQTGPMFFERAVALHNAGLTLVVVQIFLFSHTTVTTTDKFEFQL